MDIMLAGSTENSAKMVYAVIETFKDSQNKHWQALAYANNISWFLNSFSQMFYVVELGFDSNISLYACMCKDNVRLKTAFIWEGAFTMENLSKLLFVLVHLHFTKA